MTKPNFQIPAPENCPQLERVFAVGQLEPFLKLIEDRRSTLRALVAAKDADARRATAALAAYDLGLALIQRIDQIRHQAATSAPAPR